MKRLLRYSLALFLILVFAVASLLGIFPFPFSFSGRSIPKALACYQYAPTGGLLQTGTEVTVSATNVGSWRGTLASDNIYWSTTNLISSNPSLDKRIYIDGVALNGANKLVITYEGYVSATGLTYLVQIYDNSSSTWRTLNDRGTTLSSISDATYTYEIYDGYWTVTTPLANFITTDSNKRVQLRIYSTASILFARFHYLDRMQLETAVDTYYTAGGMTNTFGGTVGNNYTWTYKSDNNRMSVRNNVSGKPMDYYLSFKNVQYYSDANAILVNYEGYISNATGWTYNVKIYNFNTPGWETLNSTALSNAGGVDAVYQFAKSNITMSRYVSGGEIRVGFLGSAANNSYYHYVDQLYVAVGSVNTNAGLSEVSFGSVPGGTSTDTQSLDTTAASPVTWQQATAATATAPYASDWGGTYGTNYSAACNLSFPVTVPTSAAVTGVRYAAYFRSNVTTNTVELGIKDYSGQFTGVTVAGGWTAVGTTNALTTYTYTDGILQTNPEDSIDTTNNRANLRLRTSVSTAISTTTRDWDFAFVSIRWILDSSHPSYMYQSCPAGGSLPIGAERTVDATNVGTWRGALASDDIYWSTDNSTGGGGLDKRINIDGIVLNSANKLVITYEGYVSNAALTYLVQIYDNPGGTWRTLNDYENPLPNTSDTTYTFEIYNGYWNSGGSPINTPLANFITTDANKRVQLRIYSTYTSATYYHLLDRMQLETAVDTYMTAGGMTNTFGGSVGLTYNRTYKGDGQAMSLQNNVPGKPMDFYYSFKNVEYYSGANAILVYFRGGAPSGSLHYNIKIYNFNTPGWETLNSTVLSDAPYVAYQFAVSNIDVSRYAQGGQIRVGFESSTSNDGYYLYVDQLYVVAGSVNTNTGLSEVSFGSAAGGTTSTNTQSLDTTLASPVTWQQTSAATATAPYAYDWGGTYGSNDSAASNLSFPVTVPTSAAVTGVRYAARFRSANTTTSITVQLGIEDYSGQFTGVTIAGGWTDVGTPNTSSTYTYTDGILQTNPEDSIDTTNNRANLRLRTSASSTIGHLTRDWDFAFVSIRWIGSLSPTGSLTLSGQSVTWTNVNQDNPPNNTGKGLTCTVSCNTTWSVTVTTSSGDPQGQLWSAANSLAYGGTFKYTSTGAAGPTYQGSATSFTTSGTNIANYTTPVTFWPITASYTLGTITWTTLKGSYTSTHTYTLLAL
jgi:hypothetical protein